MTSPVKPRSSQLAKGHFHYISSQSLIHKVSQTYFPSGEYKSKREVLKLNVIFLSLFMYLKIMKIDNLRKDTNPHGGGDEGSNTKGLDGFGDGEVSRQYMDNGRQALQTESEMDKQKACYFKGTISQLLQESSACLWLRSR